LSEAQQAPGDNATAPHQGPQVQRSASTTLYADDRQQPVGRQQLNMITEIPGAYRVQDHVYTVVGDLPNLGRPIAAVGDGVICANGEAVAQLVLATCGRDHCGSETLGVLNGE
jgi:hypothetical protein